MKDLNACEKWLKNELKNGVPMLTTSIAQKAKKQGFTRRDLKEARKTLGVISQRFPENTIAGVGEHWMWSL